MTDPGLASASTSQRSSQEVFNFRDGRGHSGVTLACAPSWPLDTVDTQQQESGQMCRHDDN